MPQQPVNIAASDQSPLLTTSKLAAEFGVDPSAVRRWVESGKITPAVITPGGHYRFDRDAVHQELRRARRRVGGAA